MEGLAAALSLFALRGTLILAAEAIPYHGTFKIPELEVVWKALNAPRAEDLAMEWRDIDPRQDPSAPLDWWECWVSSGILPFYGGVRLPAEQFLLRNLYREGELRYPNLSSGQGTFPAGFTIHESLAWLYAWKSPANPMYGSRPLRLRAQQLALIHLVGLTQHAPDPPIEGGWSIQYGHPLAWNAHTLELLNSVDPLDPELRAAWIACLDHVARELDRLGPEGLQTPMGHWNLWPVAGAFFLARASGLPEHRALFERWAEAQLLPDRYTSRSRYHGGTSPLGITRYVGVDIGYNGQSKQWMVPLFVLQGPDSLAGDFIRRQYRFSSHICLEEPDGQLLGPQHMSSHSDHTPANDQWQFHRNIVYAVEVPDAVPFARFQGYRPDKMAANVVERFLEDQASLPRQPWTIAEPLKFSVRGYPAGTPQMTFPVLLAYYPSRRPRDLAVRTRPHEHLAYAAWFRSPIVRDEFFTRRKPSYHFTLYSGPCNDTLSNYGTHLNGLGAGGLSQLWIQDLGTVLLAYNEFKEDYQPESGSASWAGMPMNMLVLKTRSGKVLSTGWTGSLMTADPRGDSIVVEGGVNPEVRGTWGTPMTDAVRWERRFEFRDREVAVHVKARPAADEIAVAYEILPIACFDGAHCSATARDGKPLTSPWKGDEEIRAFHIRRGEKGGLDIVLPRPLAASLGEKGKAGTLALRLDVTPLARDGEVGLSYTLRVIGPPSPPAVKVLGGSVLPGAKVGEPYAIVLEAEEARAVYWSVAEGKLPDELILRKDGLLSGRATEEGAFSIDLLGASPYSGRPFFEKDVRASRVSLRVGAR